MKTYLPRKRAECQLIENIKDLCRLCLNECVNGVPIYPDSDCEAQPLLVTKIMMCVGIEVTHNDELSNQVCLHCIGEINTIYSFRKVCEIAYKRMKRHIHACQQIKYRLKSHHIDIFTKSLNKNSERNEKSVDEGNVSSTQKGKDNAIVSDENIKDLHMAIKSPIENVTKLDQQQNAALNDSEQFPRNTYLDENIGKLQIVEMNQDLESHNNIEGFEITAPILETNQNNELNQNNTNLENFNDLQGINNIDLCKTNAIKIIENNILVPKSQDLTNNSNSISEENYCIQVLLAGQSDQMNNDSNSNGIYFAKAKEAGECADAMEYRVNSATAAVSTSNFNTQTDTNDISNLDEEKSNLTEVMSEFIVLRLIESGIVKMEGDAIATCEIGTMRLETSNGDIVEMEIVEEELREKRKYNMSVRKKKPDAAHACSWCGLVLQSAAAARRHSLRHAGGAARTHRCPHCASAFTLKDTLRRHLHTHLAERPFACGACGARFSQRGGLRAHVRSRHRAARTLHACRLCRAAYMHPSGLTRHVKKHHLGNTTQCEDCLKTLADSSSLRRHKAVCPKAQVQPHFESIVLDLEYVGKPNLGPDILETNGLSRNP